MPQWIPDALPDDIKKHLTDEVRPLLDKMIDAALDEHDAMFIKEHLVLWIGEERKRSAMLGEYIKPCKGYPEGAVMIHVDALYGCTEAIGDTADAVLANTLFHEVVHWFQISARGLDYLMTQKDEHRADTVARQYCNKLYNKRILSKMPIDLHTDKEAAMSFMLWLREWTGMTIKEWEEDLKETISPNYKV